MKRLAGLALVLCQLVAHSVRAETVLCRMQTASAPGYIAPEISLELKEQNKVIVKDAVITSTGRDHVFGKISKDDGRRLSVVWKVAEVPIDPSETRAYSLTLQVRLSMQRSDGAARITLVDGFYLDKSYSGTGTCQVTK